MILWFGMMTKNMANYITSLRIFLLPFLIYFVISGDKAHFFWLSLFMMTTDAADGTIARILKQESAFGRMIDSIADFCFYPTFFVGNIILLHLFSFIPAWLVIGAGLLPIVSTWIVAFIMIGRLPFLHLRAWQITTYSFLLFSIVSFTRGVSVFLFYLYVGVSLLAFIEEISIFFRDGRAVDSAIHSFFEKTKKR